jgi:hypothetical protein
MGLEFPEELEKGRGKISAGNGFQWGHG